MIHIKVNIKYAWLVLGLVEVTGRMPPIILNKIFVDNFVFFSYLQQLPICPFCTVLLHLCLVGVSNAVEVVELEMQVFLFGGEGR